MSTLKIASWNVNSVKARIDNITHWIKQEKPDILSLQELKCESHSFPYLEFEELGYNIAVVGQKSWNGVAILSKMQIEDVIDHLPNAKQEEARYVEAVLSIKDQGLAVRVASVYVPNGGGEKEKLEYKLEFFSHLDSHLAKIMKYDEIVFIAGDYNVAPDPIDLFDPNYVGIGCSAAERQAWHQLTNSGWIDSWRALHPHEAAYSWWDYRAGSWQQNKGMRIDHILASPLAADRLHSSYITSNETRDLEKASDHAPVVVVACL